ncbi:MAG: metallophosphoesterase [Polyangiaceae bacterium]
MDALRTDLLEFGYDLLVLTGDLTQRARRAQYEQCMAFLSSLPDRRLIVPGNHDIAPLYCPWQRLFDPYRSYRRYVATDLDQTYWDDDVFVVGLNTVDPLRWKEGTISREQLHWLELQASRRSRSKLSILAAHHPLAHLETTGLKHSIRRHASLLELLDRLDFALVLTGHLHESYSGIAASSFSPSNRLLVAQASTATSTRVRGHLNGYNRIVIDLPELSVDLRTWNGNTFVTERMSRFRRVATELTPAQSDTSLHRGRWLRASTPSQPLAAELAHAESSAASER